MLIGVIRASAVFGKNNEPKAREQAKTICDVKIVKPSRDLAIREPRNMSNTTKATAQRQFRCQRARI
jgi:hypothetical protein